MSTQQNMINVRNVSQHHEESSYTKKKPLHVQTLFIKHESPSKLLGEPFCIFCKFVKVFDLYFVASNTAPDDKLLHAASVFYQYIDNDDDGIPDNMTVYEALVETRATMVMFKNSYELDKYALGFFPLAYNVNVQDIFSDDVIPNPLNFKMFDTSLEKCFKLICTGYAKAYPDLFGFWKGSHIGVCYKNAINKHFTPIQENYNSPNAWCECYEKQDSFKSQYCEYMFWAMTSILGAHQKRRRYIMKNWRLHRPSDVESNDVLVYSLLTDPKFGMPKKLPESIWHDVRRKSEHESILYKSFKNKSCFFCCISK